MSLRHVLAASAAVALTLTGCATQPGPAAAPPASPTPSTRATTEVRSLNPRIVVASDGALTTIDTVTGATVASTAQPGFLRLNNAGDGRHVLVSDGDVFRVYDAGVWAEPHGDHSHYFTSTPRLTDVTYAAPKAGHVVLHDGRTTLFADGTGGITIVKSSEIAKTDAAKVTSATDAAHHGVAIAMEGNALLTTQGTKDARSTVQFKVGDRVASETTNCPGVHGEATAQPNAKGDVAVFGCENGPVVFRDGAFSKVTAADAYARTGNLVGHHDSPIVLGDYKVDKAATPERTTRISLIDTRTSTMELVDLGSAYWFRSLARGPHGEAVVLTNDGNLSVVDVTTKKISRIPVIGSWLEDADWQKAGPAVKVAGSLAYVSDVAKKEIVVVNLDTHSVVKRLPLQTVPVEIAVVTGSAEGTSPHQH